MGFWNKREDEDPEMNDYERYGRYWAAVQLSYKVVNSGVMDMNGLPLLADAGFVAKLRAVKENAKIVYELLESIVPEES